MDPERPIEKLLRQAAQARRAQADAPQELHPANRRMLQGEVARKFAAAPQRRSFFELFLPRLAWGAAVVVGLGLAASLMLPRQNAAQKEVFFAKNDRASAPRTVNETPAPASALSKSLAPAEAPALARTEVAQAGRDKDALNLERQRTESHGAQPLALNEPAAAPGELPREGTRPTPVPKAEGRAESAATARQSETQMRRQIASADSLLAGEKQKEELASKAYGGAAPPQTPARETNALERRYAFAPTAQPAPSSAAPAGNAGAAASSTLKLSDETAKADLAQKSAPPMASAAPARLGVQLQSANSVDNEKRAPAPVARVTQQFVETVALNKNADFADKSAATRSILTSFELQQVGREVRIVDSDGSVYSGAFQSPETFSELDSYATQNTVVTRSAQASALKSERKGGLYDSKLQTDVGYAFKVTGTNQSLNQIVTFTGQVFAPTNALSVSGPAGTLNGNRIAPPELNPLPLQNSRISGKAVIGTNQAVEVNAIPSH
jgi:hypothetical protein